MCKSQKYVSLVVQSSEWIHPSRNVPIRRLKAEPMNPAHLTKITTMCVDSSNWLSDRRLSDYAT